jgi:hypothetical protein
MKRPDVNLAFFFRRRRQAPGRPGRGAKETGKAFGDRLCGCYQEIAAREVRTRAELGFRLDVF